MGTGTFYPKKTKFFSGLKVPVPIVPSITTGVFVCFCICFVVVFWLFGGVKNMPIYTLCMINFGPVVWRKWGTQCALILTHDKPLYVVYVTCISYGYVRTKQQQHEQPHYGRAPAEQPHCGREPAEIRIYTVNVLNFSNTFLFCFQIKRWFSGLEFTKRACHDSKQ